MSPLDGALEIVTPLTDDAVNVPPATLCPVLFDIACVPRPKVASSVPPDKRIVPLFNANALVPMLNPSASTSAVTTVYRNTSAVVPLPLA